MKNPTDDLVGPKQTLTEVGAGPNDLNPCAPGTQKPVHGMHTAPYMGLSEPSMTLDRNIVDASKADQPKYVVPQPKFGVRSDD